MFQSALLWSEPSERMSYNIIVTSLSGQDREPFEDSVSISDSGVFECTAQNEVDPIPIERSSLVRVLCEF